MNVPENNDNPDMDAWLRSQPLEPSKDFAEKTIARMHANQNTADDFEETLDTLLAHQLVEPPPHFADKVVAEITSEHVDADPKILGFPSWVFTLGTMAATLAIMMTAFTWMFNRGIENQHTPVLATDNSTAISSEPLVITASTDKPITIGDNDDQKTFIATMDIDAIENPISTDELQEIEELLFMDETLTELSSLSEGDNVWETIALLVEE